MREHNGRTNATRGDLRRVLSRALAGLALIGLLLTPAWAQADEEEALRAQGCVPNETVRLRGATARLENDLFTGTDQNYTNGVAFTLVSHDMTGRLRPECLPVLVRIHSELIKFMNPGFWADASDSTNAQNVVIKFGQSMFTPKDFSRTDLITDDRPYAGLLYVGMSWNRRAHRPSSKSEVLDTREITLGVIGPWSLAEPVQNAVHEAMGADRFLGWHHQLKNEPAVQLALDRKFRGYRGKGAIVPGFSADAIRSLGLRLGNIETSATLGIEGRMGWNLPNDFGSYPIRPGAENRPPSAASIHGNADGQDAATVRPRPGIHLFAVVETKFIVHDFSLDGNLLRASPGVARRPWVSQAAVGVSIQGLLAGRGVRLAVMRVYRTREFEEQQTNQAYGSIALSVEF